MKKELNFAQQIEEGRIEFAKIKLEEAVVWLGMDLRALGEEEY